MAIIVKGGGGKLEEEKTVTAGTSVIEVLPSSGKTMKKVTINPAPVPTWLILTSPTKTSYNAGEKLDLTGLTVKAKFSDGTEQDITSECTFSPSNGTVLYEDTSEVVVSWSYGGAATCTAKQPITVKRVLSSIAITKNPNKTTYYKGESLSLSGLKVMATFTSGATEEVTSLCTSDPASGYVFSSFGSVSVVISYTENGVTKTATTPVTVTVKTVAFNDSATDQEIIDMLDAHEQGIINITDYWTVNDTRTASISSIAATGVGESHAAQQVHVVLSHRGGQTLEDGSACTFQWDFVEALAEAGYMNSSNTNSGGYDGSARAPWNDTPMYNALPAWLKKMTKPFKVTSGVGGGASSGLQTTVHKLALRAEKEVFGSRTYSFSDEANALTQVDYYKTADNRKKKLGISGSVDFWWLRSSRSGNSSAFCCVGSDGSANGSGASNTRGLAPFGCF